MSCTTQLRNVVLAAVAASVSLLAAPAAAIEMFTYFGDGSQIGLPSLEVPIEAYPGIPLRSDRLRARRAGKAPPSGTVGYFRGRGVTIRVPVQQQPRPGSVGSELPGAEPVAASEPVGADDAVHTAPTAVDSAAAEGQRTERAGGLDFGGLRDLSAYEQSLPR
ncbi:MAG: hypothetical protein O2946_09820 [Planctomycetota bacterium]|jgi:hypothetical protein|nr:hypothetical protein [Planctomycetota bacterium]MDA0969979.1 hypothetical protein [Planctomycetota bacterium]